MFACVLLEEQFLGNPHGIHVMFKRNCNLRYLHSFPDLSCDLTFDPIQPLQVIADNSTGLLFKNKRDRKIINVDPKV